MGTVRAGVVSAYPNDWTYDDDPERIVHDVPVDLGDGPQTATQNWHRARTVTVGPDAEETLQNSHDSADYELLDLSDNSAVLYQWHHPDFEIPATFQLDGPAVYVVFSVVEDGPTRRQILLSNGTEVEGTCTYGPPDQ